MSRLILFLTLMSSVLLVRAQNIDINLLKEFNIHRNRSLDGTFDIVSQSVTPISLFVPVIFGCVALRSNGEFFKKETYVTASSLIVSTTVTLTLKSIVKRDRPYTTYPFIEPVGPLEYSPSFPSMHTSAAFSTATSLSLLSPKWYVIVPSYTWATAVAYSRMDLGVHYPSDVLCGAIVGAGSAWLCYKINSRLFDRKKQHNKN
jgi:membrane-associated phospholipid phosphatase